MNLPNFYGQLVEQARDRLIAAGLPVHKIYTQNEGPLFCKLVVLLLRVGDEPRRAIPYRLPPENILYTSRPEYWEAVIHEVVDAYKTGKIMRYPL